MNRKIVLLATLVFGLSAPVFAGTQLFNDFVITQSNPAASSSTVVNLIKTPPQIAYFEDAADVSLFQFIENDPFAFYNWGQTATGLSGGAADILGITSSFSLNFSGDASGAMLLSSLSGTDHLFDPLFSNYYSLVFDISNIGSNSVSVLPRIGPNSSSAIYSFLDANFVPVTDNIKTIAAGDMATFIFYLDVKVDDPTVVWDYANGPANEIYLEFQPVDGVGFDVLVDNIGFAVPEPGAVLLFVFGLAVTGRAWKKR